MTKQKEKSKEVKSKEIKPKVIKNFSVEVLQLLPILQANYLISDNDDVRAYLDCMLIRGREDKPISFQSTDSHRAVLIDIPFKAEKDFEVLLDKISLHYLIKSLTGKNLKNRFVKFDYSKKNERNKNRHRVILSWRHKQQGNDGKFSLDIEDEMWEFPPVEDKVYEKAKDKHDVVLGITFSELKKSLLSFMGKCNHEEDTAAKKNEGHIQLKVKGNQLILSNRKKGDDLYEVKMVINEKMKGKNKEIDLSFQLNYLLDMIKIIEPFLELNMSLRDKLIIKFDSTCGASFFEIGERKNRLTYLVMPLRL